MASRCSNGAGAAFLSALWTLNNKSSRLGPGYRVFEARKAEVARVRWASDGGLKEESRMSRVRVGAAFGGGADVGTVRKTANLEVELMNVSTKLVDALSRAARMSSDCGMLMGVSFSLCELMLSEIIVAKTLLT